MKKNEVCTHCAECVGSAASVVDAGAALREPITPAARTHTYSMHVWSRVVLSVDPLLEAGRITLQESSALNSSSL